MLMGGGGPCARPFSTTSPPISSLCLIYLSLSKQFILKPPLYLSLLSYSPCTSTCSLPPGPPPPAIFASSQQRTKGTWCRPQLGLGPTQPSLPFIGCSRLTKLCLIFPICKVGSILIPPRVVIRNQQADDTRGVADGDGSTQTSSTCSVSPHPTCYRFVANKQTSFRGLTSDHRKHLKCQGVYVPLKWPPTNH